jgi:16S rRNA (cytidine1402-2'-O)-methyltransferase
VTASTSHDGAAMAEERAPVASLFVVATPIGNLDDLSERVRRVLADVDRVLAEDTRRTRQLLSHLAIDGKPLDRLDAAVEGRGVGVFVDRLLAGESLALVSDAGAPVVSDPGAALIQAAGRAGVRVVPVPGPSAVTTILMAAGLAGDRFRFFGFLPRSGPRRRETLAEIRKTPETVIFFESPSRIAATLDDLARSVPTREVVVARELTKLHEELIRGLAADLPAREAGRRWKGEITVAVGPRSESDDDEPLDEATLDARIDELLARGMRAKDVAKALALDSGHPARAIYARITDRKANDS